MHMVMVIGGGLLLLAVFCLFGRLWGQSVADIALGAKWFLPVWAAVALTNMWVGVTRAGYTLMQEAPILAIVLLVPAAVAVLVIWQVGKG